VRNLNTGYLHNGSVGKSGKAAMRTDILDNRELIEKWISEKRPKRDMCRDLRCKQQTLNNYLKKMGILYEGNQGAVGWTRASWRLPVETRLFKGSVVGSHNLKNLLIRDNYKERKCEECGLYEWNNKPIPIELHHIDGDRFNNELSNLKILCRNCHGLCDNHAGKSLRGQTRQSRPAQTRESR
jgi:hypothetical protein